MPTAQACEVHFLRRAGQTNKNYVTQLSEVSINL